MEKISISTTSKKYPVYIGHQIIPKLPSIIAECLGPSKILVISDENVAALYLECVIRVLEESYEVVSFVVPASEKSKSIEFYYRCQTFALQEGLDRKSMIIALGGGVVGDLAGFVAATFMRGIPFIQIPTTLLAHDSAVGGKVAINHDFGKNMIGAFYQPEAVVYDTNFLKTLPISELRSGFAEVIKRAIIWDSCFYQWLLEHIHSLNDINEATVNYLIKTGIGIKASIVSMDEKENGIRAILNFGHTLGHAIESELGYGKITHGDGVALGMIFAVRVSEKVYKKDFNIDGLINWFQQFHFPTKLPEHISIEELLLKMEKDKKTTNKDINMVLLKDIGRVEVKKVDKELLYTLLELSR